MPVVGNHSIEVFPYHRINTEIKGQQGFGPYPAKGFFTKPMYIIENLSSLIPVAADLFHLCQK